MSDVTTPGAPPSHQPAPDQRSLFQSLTITPEQIARDVGRLHAPQKGKSVLDDKAISFHCPIRGSPQALLAHLNTVRSAPTRVETEKHALNAIDIRVKELKRQRLTQALQLAVAMYESMVYEEHRAKIESVNLNLATEKVRESIERERLRQAMKDQMEQFKQESKKRRYTNELPPLPVRCLLDEIKDNGDDSGDAEDEYESDGMWTLTIRDGQTDNDTAESFQLEVNPIESGAGLKSMIAQHLSDESSAGRMVLWTQGDDFQRHNLQDDKPLNEHEHVVNGASIFVYIHPPASTSAPFPAPPSAFGSFPPSSTSASASAHASSA